MFELKSLTFQIALEVAEVGLTLIKRTISLFAAERNRYFYWVSEQNRCSIFEIQAI